MAPSSQGVYNLLRERNSYPNKENSWKNVIRAKSTECAKGTQRREGNTLVLLLNDSCIWFSDILSSWVSSYLQSAFSPSLGTGHQRECF